MDCPGAPRGSGRSPAIFNRKSNKNIGKDRIAKEEKRIEDQKKLCPYDKNEFRNDPTKLRKYLIDNEKEILGRIHSYNSNEPDELI